MVRKTEVRKEVRTESSSQRGLHRNRTICELESRELVGEANETIRAWIITVIYLDVGRYCR